MDGKVLSNIENQLNDRVINFAGVGGGSIAQSYILNMESGNRYFLKSGFSNSMFYKEANGLNELAKSCAFRIPKVILVQDNFLLLEYIQKGVPKSNFSFQLGKNLAIMHRFTSENFGFYEDNFIGATKQKNLANDSEKNSWSHFYWNKRLLYQFNLAEKNGYVSAGFSRSFTKLESLFSEIIRNSDEPPTLLHGDLWSGNYMCDESGEPVLVDPAVYYGHREADLAMTKLFGGFSPEFYITYQKEFPLKKEWEYRENIYKLYHILNHLNLFGVSYLSEAEILVNGYL